MLILSLVLTSLCNNQIVMRVNAYPNTGLYEEIANRKTNKKLSIKLDRINLFKTGTFNISTEVVVDLSNPIKTKFTEVSPNSNENRTIQSTKYITYTYFCILSGEHAGKYILEGEFKITSSQEDTFSEPNKAAWSFDVNDIKTDRRVRSALIQNVYSRNMLYFPKTIVKDQLQKAATMIDRLITLIKEKYSHLDEEEELSSSNLMRAFTSRILSNNGILRNESVGIFEFMIKRVKSGTEVQAKERATVLALMGDIAAMILDKKDHDPLKSENQVNALQELLISLIKNKNDLDEDKFELIASLNGSKTVGPEKKKERKMNGPTYDRTGIYNLGLFADKIIREYIQSNYPNVTVNLRDKALMTLDDKNKNGYFTSELLEPLSPKEWGVAKLPLEKIKNTYSEALASHMSGSPCEILHIWDVLLGYDPVKSYYEKEINDEKLARSMTSAAFLISMGYHSAVEVIEGTLKYLGKSIRVVDISSELDYTYNLQKGKEDASYIFYNGEATRLLSEEFNNLTKTPINFEEIKKQYFDNQSFMNEIKDFLVNGI